MADNVILLKFEFIQTFTPYITNENDVPLIIIAGISVL
jgi:hypothetical protein